MWLTKESYILHMHSEMYSRSIFSALVGGLSGRPKDCCSGRIPKPHRPARERDGRHLRFGEAQQHSEPIQLPSGYVRLGDRHQCFDSP